MADCVCIDNAREDQKREQQKEMLHTSGIHSFSASGDALRWSNLLNKY